MSFGPNYYVQWSPGPKRGHLPWSNIGLTLLSHPLFRFILVFITSCCPDFYSFVLCSSLLSTSYLTGPCLSPHY